MIEKFILVYLKLHIKTPSYETAEPLRSTVLHSENNAQQVAFERESGEDLNAFISSPAVQSSSGSCSVSC